MSKLLQLRVDEGVALVLERLATKLGCSDSTVVEHLLLDGAYKEGVIGKDDPNLAMHYLLKKVATVLDSRPKFWQTTSDVVYQMFELIRKTPRYHEVYLVAVGTDTKRKQYVHNRIGRYIKDHLGMESVGEVTLPRNSDALIRAYSKLVKH